MSKISKKLRRSLAIVLALVMVASVAVPSTPAQAAAKKYVKSLKVSPAKVTLTSGQAKTVKATVKVSGKAKKNVTVKSSNKNVVTVKAKKANKKGVSTITLTAKTVTAKKSAKITVTTSAKNKKGKKIKKTINVTVNPKPGSSVKPTPPVTKVNYKVTGVSAINTSTGEVVLTFDSAVTASNLAGTTLTIKGENGSTVTATFSKVSAAGNSATYVISAADLGKLTTGNYTITSSAASIQIPSTIGNTSAKVQITGSSVKGFVYDISDPEITIPNAKVTIDGSTVSTDKYGFYQKSQNAGSYPVISVKANGYFDESKTDIKVASNKASAYNFEMERYDISKVYICGTVVDADDSQTPITGATVVLFEDGVVKATLQTDAKGHYVFKNSRATVKNFESSSVRTFSYSANIRTDKKYNIVITKNLSKSNLKDVYKQVDTDVINLGSSRNVNVDTTMKKVKNLGEITMDLSWVADTVLKSADSTKVNVKFVATDGETELVAAKEIDLKDYLNDQFNGMKKTYKLAAEDYFGTGANVHPTLPTGTYYMIVTDKDAEGAQANATTVIPVSVTEGGSVDATASIVPAVSRTVNYTTSYTDTYKDKALKNQTGVLKKVIDSEGTLGTGAINVTAKVYQVVGGKNVLVRTKSGIQLSEANNAYVYSEDIKNLASNQNYSIETIKTNLTADAKSIKAGDSATVTIDLKGAANVVRLKMKNANCFIDDEADDKVAASTEKVRVNSVTLTGAGGSYTAPIDAEYTLAQLVSGVAVNKVELMGLKPGKYTVSFNIDGYKLSADKNEQDEEQDVIDLQDATIECEAKYNKVYPTTIMGAITAKVVADNAKLSADGLAVLYTSDMKKIVAAGELYRAANGAPAFKLEDGVNGNFGAGTYKLIVRADGIDNLVKDITITDVNKIYKNQDITNVEAGGKSGFRVPITTSTGAVLDGSAVVMAFDEYYRNPFDLSSVDILAMDYLLDNYGYIGAYEFERAGSSTETWTLEDISAGKYTIAIDSNITKYTEITRNVSGLNEEAIKVPMLVYDDLVRIQLIITNRNDDSFAAGQIDFITVESADGKIYRYGYTQRTKQKEEVVAFYVPKNQSYTVNVYSSDSQVGETKVASQSKENEEIDVTCQDIK